VHENCGGGERNGPKRKDTQAHLESSG